MRWLSSLKKRRGNDRVVNNEYSLKKLTPTKCEKMEYYEETLDYVFSEMDLLNIAITGPYSAGKSSVMKTYEDKHIDDKKFIHISLAHFGQAFSEVSDEAVEDEQILNGDKNCDTNKSGIENELETKMINQLIHQIDSDKIPQTRFKIKRSVSMSKIVRYSSYFIGYILNLTYLLNYNKIVEFMGEKDEKSILHWEFLTNDFTLFIAIIIASIMTAIIIYKCIRRQLETPMLKKLTFQDNDIEIYDEEEDSFFDKYLDEIMYLLDKSEADAIVFEDIDRFENIQIFEKLREINYLINKKYKKRQLKFFYLLRDDIFISKDRTKFFDFIIPIIPVLDSSNSYDKILDYFKDVVQKLTKDKNKDKLDFDKHFLEQLSLYIDDMRILKNIYNEFVIYYGRMQETELDPNKLLSLIVYKNIFPRDFGHLQLNKGFVYNIFMNKELYIKEEQKKINGKINIKKEEIKNIKNEFLKNVNELDVLYLNYPLSIVVNSKTPGDFANKTLFIAELKKIGSGSYNSGYYTRTYDVKQEIQELNDNSDYQNRKNNIEQKEKNQIDKIEKEIKKLIKTRSIMETYKLKELNKEQKIDEVFNNNDLESEYITVTNSHYYPLIKFLIRNGYIDETYFDYLSYFYETNLPRTDKIFLRSITDENKKEFGYKLIRPGIILNRLRKNDFTKEETLNFDLVDYLIKNNHESLDTLLEQIRGNERLDFVWEYISREQLDINITREFVKKLNCIWPGIWVHIFETDSFTRVQKKEYMYHTLYASYDDLLDLNKDMCISNYISATNDFLKGVTDLADITKLQNCFIRLNIKFINIDIDTDRDNEMLWFLVCQSNMFELNYINIWTYLRCIYHIDDINLINHKNYSCIRRCPDESLAKYVEEEIEQYVSVLIAFINAQEENEQEENEQEKIEIRDELKDALLLINNEKISDNPNLIAYAEFLRTDIPDLSKVSSYAIWDILMNNGNIAKTTENFITYYFSSGVINETLIKFINNSSEIELKLNEIEERYGSEDAEKVINDIVQCNEILNEKYENLVTNYGHVYDEFTYTRIPCEKIMILIKNKVIALNKVTLIFMRNNYSTECKYFIITNIDLYEECMDDNLYIEEEFFDIVLDDSVADIIKKKLILKSPYPVQIENKNFSDEVISEIIDNKFNINDLEYIITRYGKWSFKEKVINLFFKYFDTVLEFKNKLSEQLLLDAMYRLSTNQRKYLLVNQIHWYDVDATINFLKVAEFNDYASLFEGKQPSIEITEEDQAILNIFKERDWITPLKEDNKKIGYYRVRAKKIK